MKEILSGHKECINCIINIQHHPDGIPTLISGSDDKTIRLWDLRGKKAVQCIASMFPTPVTAIECGQLRHPFLLYASSENTVYSFDLRFQGVLCKTALSPTIVGFDSINDITIHSREESLAVADDSGTITIVPLETGGLLTLNSERYKHRKLSRVHSNLVNSIHYNRDNPKELISGGFDCICCLWDCSIARPKATASFGNDLSSLSKSNSSSNDNNVNQQDNKTQIFNPPFVQSLGYLLSGKLIAVGLGDGTIRLLDAKKLNTIHQVIAHNGMITAMVTDNDTIYSGGIDKKVKGWKIIQNSSAKSFGVLDCHMTFEIEHPFKINTMKSNDGTEQSTEKCLYIGDTSNDLTIYKIF